MRAEPPFPACKECGALARPAVLMFHDQTWVGNSDAEERYVAWEAAMEDTICRADTSNPSYRLPSSAKNAIDTIHSGDNTPANLVILELGCGTRVTSIRDEVGMVFRDIRSRLQEIGIEPSGMSSDGGQDDNNRGGSVVNKQQGKVFLIRVNADPQESIITADELGFNREEDGSEDDFLKANSVSICAESLSALRMIDECMGFLTR